MTGILLWWLTPAHAAVLTVDPATGSDYPTIAAAVEAASSGDTVVLVSGTYAECVDTQGKDLTISGPTTTPAAVIDGTGLCWSTVAAENGETLSLDHITIANTGGRGLYFWESSANLESVVFEALGAADVAGGAIYGAYGALSTNDCRFAGNAGDEGGAVYLYDAVQWSDTGSTFSDNTSARSGGAVFAYANHTIDWRDTTFTDNESGEQGGAVYLAWYSAITSSRNTFTGNIARYSGGAVYTYVVTGDLTFEDAEFSGNQALDGWGGAIEVEWYSLLEVIRSQFEGNSASAAGGAISQWYETSGMAIDSVFIGNTATASGGAWFWNPYQGRAHDLILDGTTFTDNASGGWGGAVYGSWGRQVGIARSTFRRNNAVGNGGGLAIYVATDVAVHDTEFCGNTAYLGGGAQVEWADGDAVTNSRFIDNLAERGAGLFRYSSNSGRSEYNTFVGNEANTWGGAYVDEWGTSTLDNTAFFHNVGGAIFTEFAATASSTSVQFDAWGDNTPVDGAGYFQVRHGTDGHVAGAPLFVAYTPGDPCEAHDLHPMAGSVLIDAANPDDTDLDASRADIGAYGGAGAPLEDADGDGVTSDTDCIDGDPRVYPGADEICDGVDNDCSGTVDGSDAIDATAWFEDADGDGYGDPSTETWGCGGIGLVSASGDCDDTDGGIHPAATERWYDGVDADCAGDSDHDADGDGWDKPVGDNGGRDCDDTDPTTYPAAEDPPGDGIDQDCDGADDRAPEPDDSTDVGAAQTDNDGKVSGCTTVGGVPSGFAALGLALLGVQRRKRRRT